MLKMPPHWLQVILTLKYLTHVWSQSFYIQGFIRTKYLECVCACSYVPVHCCPVTTEVPPCNLSHIRLYLVTRWQLGCKCRRHCQTHTHSHETKSVRNQIMVMSNTVASQGSGRVRWRDGGGVRGAVDTPELLLFQQAENKRPPSRGTLAAVGRPFQNPQPHPHLQATLLGDKTEQQGFIRSHE